MYQLITGEFYNEDHGKYTSYGVACEEEMIKIPDISLNLSSVEKFVATLNKLELSVIHIYDAVDDFLGTEYGY